MTLKAIVLGSALTAACTLPVCFAGSDYTLTTVNNLDNISTLEIGSLCSDSSLMQPFENCDTAVAGQTPAGETSHCVISVNNLYFSCPGSCSIKVYNDANCAGEAVGTGTLSVSGTGVDMSDMSGNISYSATDNYHGILDVG